MQSLPTPVTTENLNNLLATLEGLATVEVTRHTDVIKATAIKRATGKRERVTLPKTTTVFHISQTEEKK